MIFGGLRSDSRTRRRILLCAVGIIVVGIVGTAVGLAAGSLASTADVIAWATLLLAVVAALVALLAYAAATGLPKLEFQISFPSSYPNYPNRPVLFATDGGLGILHAQSGRQTYAEIRVRNTSDYSARNPAFVIHLSGMAFNPAELPPGWTEVDAAFVEGVTAVQWDGEMHSIHGQSTRRLPAVGFLGLRTVPEWGEPKFVIELLAEGGYRRTKDIPVRFTTDDSEWKQKPPAHDQPPPRWL